MSAADLDRLGAPRLPDGYFYRVSRRSEYGKTTTLWCVEIVRARSGWRRYLIGRYELVVSSYLDDQPTHGEGGAKMRVLYLCTQAKSRLSVKNDTRWLVGTHT